MFTIWVTTACNMKCRYCYEGIEKENKYMTSEMADQVINWIIKTADSNKKIIYLVRFHGGEPLLSFAIIKYIIEGLEQKSSHKFSYHITTNGYYLNEEIIEYLSQHMDVITVSIDGNKRTNDLNRLSIQGESTFDMVLHNAKLLNAEFSNLEIRMTVDIESCKYLSENILFLLNEGFTLINAEMDFTNQGWTVEAVDIVESECRKIKQMRLQDDRLKNIGLPIGYSASNMAECTGGIDGFSIDPEGNIYPCIMTVGDLEMCVGNVVSGIREDWKCYLRDISALEMPACEGCGGYKSCSNVRCRLVNKKVMGDYLSPIPLLCELHRRNLEFPNIV